MSELVTTAKPQGYVDPLVLEGVVVGGNLANLSPEQRLDWYRARCEAAGLDVRTQPFQYLSLKGKLTLYATKAATDQLIASRHLTVEIPERRYDDMLGIYEARCRVTFPDGRHVEDVAAVPMADLAGEDLCNAVMKCVTKAKRRTVLSACGLGMLDETEVETIPGATRVNGHPRQVYTKALPTPRVDPPSVMPKVKDNRPYHELAFDGLTSTNDQFRDDHPGASEVVVSYQLDRHLVRLGLEAQVIDATLVPNYPKAKAVDLARALTVAYQTPEGYRWIRREMPDYLAGKLAEARAEAAVEGQGDGETFEEIEGGDPVPVAADDVSRHREPGEEG